MELWLLFRQKQVGRRRESEKIQIMVPFHSYPTRNRKFQKNSQKNSKTPFWLLFKQKQVAKGREREKIKIIDPLCSYQKRNRKLEKNTKKFKNLKNTIIASFEAKIDWKWMRMRKNKNCRSAPLLPDG